MVHTLSYGDAISGEVFALQRCFRELGYKSDIYAINIHPYWKGHAIDYRELSLGFQGEVLLHYSIGSALNTRYRSMYSARRTIIYHNLTPAQWFDGVNPRIVRELEEGRQELPGLCEISDRIIADSNYNADDLKSHGFEAQVLELPLDPRKWTEPANPGIAALLSNDPSVHVLHVGRLAPNKCIEDIIKVFYFVHHHITHQSRLWLVGIDIDTELYAFALKRLVMELKLDHAVTFAGCKSDAEVRALYENSSVYLCMSEHEGFCLPVVEAMYFGLPVMAYASTALPQTIGRGGILLREKRHPEIAEVLVRLAKDPELRQKVKEAGKKRVADLSIDVFKARVKELFQTRDRFPAQSAVR
jgi:glycosyltransferase involved in cell wall biosynthesis